MVPRVERTVVHLVRHGEVENPARIRYGRLDGFVLSATGREQATRAGDYLAMQTPRIGVIHTSPLERARETATLIAGCLDGVPLRLDDRLIEAESRFDGLTRAFAFRPYLARHVRSLFGSRRVESPSEVAVRIETAIRDLVRDARANAFGAIVVVSHEVPIRYARFVFERGAPWRLRVGAVPRVGCRYASITSIAFDSERVAGVQYVDLTHGTPVIR